VSALTPICFVSLLSLYELGFDKLDELPENTIDNILKSREAEIKNMIEMQFVLAYHSNISKEDSDNMTPFEIKNWYNFLQKQSEINAET
jgi:hypothetical protein